MSNPHEYDPATVQRLVESALAEPSDAGMRRSARLQDELGVLVYFGHYGGEYLSFVEAHLLVAVRAAYSAERKRNMSQKYLIAAISAAATVGWLAAMIAVAWR